MPRTYAVVEGFYDRYAVDLNSGRVHASWLHWFDEYLRKAELFDEFVKAANAAGPNLGKAFAAYTSVPLASPIASDARARLERLSSELMFATDQISEHLGRQVYARAQDALTRWAENPVVRTIADAELRIGAFRVQDLYLPKGPPRPQADPEVAPHE